MIFLNGFTRFSSFKDSCGEEREAYVLFNETGIMIFLNGRFDGVGVEINAAALFIRIVIAT